MKRPITTILVGFLLMGLAACSRTTEEQAQTPPAAPAQPAAAPAQPSSPSAQPESPPASESKQPSKTATKHAAPPAGKTPPVSKPASGTSTPDIARPVAPATPPLPPKPVNAAVPAGTPLEIRLAQELSSATARSGDTFEGTLSQDLVVEGNLLAPKGSVVVGKLSNVEGSGRVEGRARMSLTLTEIRVGQTAYPVRTNILSFEAESTKGRDAKVVGGSAGVGAIIGAIAGGKKGAAIGAAIGAGAGTGTVMATKGKEVEFQAEQKFSFKLENDVEMRIRHQ